MHAGGCNRMTADVREYPSKVLQLCMKDIIDRETYSCAPASAQIRNKQLIRCLL